MRLVITILEAVVSVALIGLIIMQAKGTGLGSAWGGTGEFYQSRRGVEKVIFRLTIICAFLFGALAVGAILIK